MNGSFAQLALRSPTHFGSPASPLKLAVVALEQGELVLELVGHLAEQRQRAHVAEVLAEPTGEIEALVMLRIDIQERIVQLQNLECVGLAGGRAREQIAERIVRERVRGVAPN